MTVTSRSKPTSFALTIAGSDSGGGAGIQADLRAFASQSVFGLSAITAVTAQNSASVDAVQVLKPALVAAQIEAVMRDFPVAAVKTGMLATAAIVRLVAATAARRGTLPWVVDPVMIASSGAALLDPRAESVLRRLLLPQADLLTPNLPEAERLLGQRIARVSDLKPAAEALRLLGPGAVLLKGGHLEGGSVVDVYCDQHGCRAYRAPKRKLRGHGTGCSLASLIAARLALGAPMALAVEQALSVFRVALTGGVSIGRAGVLVPMPQPLPE